MSSEKRNGLIGMRVIATLGIALYHFEANYVNGISVCRIFSCNVRFFYGNDIIKKRKDIV